MLKAFDFSKQFINSFLTRLGLVGVHLVDCVASLVWSMKTLIGKMSIIYLIHLRATPLENLLAIRSIGDLLNWGFGLWLGTAPPHFWFLRIFIFLSLLKVSRLSLLARYYLCDILVYRKHNRPYNLSQDNPRIPVDKFHFRIQEDMSLQSPYGRHHSLLFFSFLGDLFNRLACVLRRML